MLPIPLGEVDGVVTVKMLKPYYIKSNAKHVRVILAYQYFSILIHEHVYHFVPIDATEIIINRKTRRIVNIDDRFGFQKGKDIIYISMAELITLPDFLIQLYFIVESYDAQNRIEMNETENPDLDQLIKSLERQNIMRLIDVALDEKDEENFHSLVELLE